VKLTYLLIGMACIVPLASNASEIITTEIYCDKTTTIMETLRKEYKEFPFTVGKANDIAGSMMSFWINPTTKSWTILSTKKDITCVIGTGKDFNLVPYDRKSV